MSSSGDIVPAPDDYSVLLDDLRGIIAAGRGQVAAVVNAAMVQTYWRIGERIVQQEQRGADRAEYGEQMLVKLAQSLSQEHGRGYSVTNLKYMRQFYLAYEKGHKLSDQLSWSHYRQLMRLEPVIRDFYERLAVSNRWSTTQLEHEIGRRLHERMALTSTPDALLASLPARPEAITFDEAFKDPYILDFLELHDPYSERDLEAALIREVERFLVELGVGFMFVERQKRITIGGEDFYPDLILYHRYMRCVVVVELKIGKFKPDYKGQMQLYLEWFRRYDKVEGEGDPIGLILVSGQNDQVVELMLSDPSERIKVSQYLTTDNREAIRAHLARLAGARGQVQEDEPDGQE